MAEIVGDPAFWAPSTKQIQLMDRTPEDPTTASNRPGRGDYFEILTGNTKRLQFSSSGK